MPTCDVMYVDVSFKKVVDLKWGKWQQTYFPLFISSSRENGKYCFLKAIQLSLKVVAKLKEIRTLATIFMLN